MLVRSQPDFAEILFAINGSILPRIWRRLTVILIVAIIAVLAAQQHPGIFQRISAIPFTLIGIALSIFMSFRNDACYSRWWEGRKLWGELLIAARSFARKIADLPHEERRSMTYLLCGFTNGLAARLRRQDERAAIARWIQDPIAESDPNPTNYILHQLGRRALALMDSGRIDSIRYSVLETELRALSVVQGGCERIATTPVPYAYSLLLHRTALVFCLTLPFALAGSLGWWALLPVLLVAYTFFGLDALGHQLEDPFRTEPNSLPVEALTRRAERDMLSLIEGEELPPEIIPQNHVLM